MIVDRRDILRSTAALGAMGAVSAAEAAGGILLGGSSQPFVTLYSANGVQNANGSVTFPADDVLFASIPFSATVLQVGAGAGGGTSGGGGGGEVLPPATVQFGTCTPMKIARGGLGSTGSLKSNPGGHTWLWTVSTTYVATGGGSVGIFNANARLEKVGSGGGAAAANAAGPWAGGPGCGRVNCNIGGGVQTYGSPFVGAGGGGAGGAGANVTVTGQASRPGDGIGYSITGTLSYYGAGGPSSGYSAGTPSGAPLGGPAGINGANGPQGFDGFGGGGGGAFNAFTGGRGGDGTITIQPLGPFSFSNSSASPAAPVQTPITLPITANLAGFYSVVQLSGWAGSCLQVIRLSDSTTLDIGFVNGLVDFAAADQFAAATRSTLTVSIFYDQSGTGNNLTGSGSGAVGLPTFPAANTFGGVRPISINGQGTTLFQALSNATFVGNRNAVSVYQIAAPRTSADYQGFFSLTDSTFAAPYVNLYHNGGSVTRLGSLDTGFNPRFAPGKISVSCSATLGQIVRVNGGQVTLANTTAQALGGIRIGIANNGSVPVFGVFDLFAFAVYNAAHTSAQMQSIEAAMAAPFSLQTTFTNRIVIAGNSLNYGQAATQNQQGYWQAGFGKSTFGPVPTWELLSMGVAARTLETEYTQKAVYAALIDGTKTLNYFEMGDPTNSISLATPISQQNAEDLADALYADTTVPYLAYELLAGYNKVGVPTTIARGAFTTANFKEYMRLRYNLNVRNGVAALGGTVIDRAAILGSYYDSLVMPSDPNYSGDTTHLINLGQYYFGLCDRQTMLGL